MSSKKSPEQIDVIHNTMTATEVAHLFAPRPPDAIFVTSGSIVQLENGEYRTTGIQDRDVRGNLGLGSERVKTASVQAKIWTSTRIITLSRSTNNTPDQGPSDAEISARELKEMDIQNPIEIREEPFDTFSELLLIVSEAYKNKWRRVKIIMPKYQEPRAQAMLDSLLHLENDAEKAKAEQMMAFNEHRFTSRELDLKKFREMYEFLSGVDKQKVWNPSFYTINEDAILTLSDDDQRYHREVTLKIRNDPSYQRQWEQDIKAAEQWTAGQYGKPR